LLLAGSALGQSTSGSITGTVVDSAGAIIQDATVNVVSQATNSARVVKSNSSGVFVVTQLPPGKYDITVEKTGFKKYVKTDVTLSAIEQLNAGDFALEVGQVSEAVTVIADAAQIQIQRESGERSGVVTGTQLRDLALNGRNYQDFLKTLPGVLTGTVSSSQVASSTGALGSFSVNGTRTNQKELTVDGSSDIDTGNNVDTHANLNPDAIAEVKVLTSNFQAEYGRAGGAFIAVVSKSGSKDFHGVARYFHRNEGLNANNFFRNAQGRRPDGSEIQPRPLYRYNYFGYDIGGPVYLPFGPFKGFNKGKDKLFFYWNQEWYEQLAPETNRDIRVPTLAERQGDFSKTTDGNGNPIIIRNPATGQPYPGNIIPAHDWFASGQAILNLYPAPNVVGDPRFNYTSTIATKYPRREDILRIDYNIGDRTHLTGRYTNNKEERLLAYGSFASGLNFPLAPISFPRPGRNGVLSLTHTFSPTLTNEFIFGPSSNFIDLRPAGDQALASTHGISVPKLFPGIGAGYVPNFRFGGIANQTFPFTDFNGLPFINVNHTFNFIDNVSKIIGSHALKMGFYAQRSRKDQTVFARTDGDINFNNDPSNALNTGHPYANALLGIYNSYIQANNFVNGLYRYWNIEGYAQDNWKVNRRLTFDYGLRVSWYQPQYDVRLQTGSFNPTQFDLSREVRLYFPVCINSASTCAGGANRRAIDPALLKTGIPPTAANTLPSNFIGAIVLGSGEIANGIGQASKGYPPGGYNSRGPQWGPRLGFAWDVFGDSKSVVRGGFGISYDRVQGNIAFDQIANPPTVLQPQLLNGRLADLAPGQAGLIAPSGVVGYALQGELPTVYSTSLGIQRDIGFKTIVDVSYVGTFSRHLFLAREANYIPLGLLFTRQAQDPTLFAGGVVPDSDPTIAQAYKDAGLKFDGSKALPANLLRRYPGLAGIRFEENGSTANFNSLQVAVNRRLSRHFTFSIAYTFSKAMGTAPADGSFVNPNDTKHYDYRLLDFDRTHSFVATYVYDLPNPGHHLGDHRLLNGLVDGWQISGITSLISGNPFELGVGVGGINVNQRITGSWTEPPRFLLKSDPAKGPNGLVIDPNAFIIPALGSLGNGNRSYLRNPGINNTDLSLFKNFRIGKEGTRRLQLRLEAFNAFNHTQFSSINAGVNLVVPNGTDASGTPVFLTGNAIFSRYNEAIITNNLRSQAANKNRPLGTFFGEYNGARDPRIIQLGVKLYW
jgi:outer membrane receptor protein involved in Fe transport